jgi:hypothetical protein
VKYIHILLSLFVFCNGRHAEIRRYRRSPFSPPPKHYSMASSLLPDEERIPSRTDSCTFIWGQYANCVSSGCTYSHHPLIKIREELRTKSVKDIFNNHRKTWTRPEYQHWIEMYAEEKLGGIGVELKKELQDYLVAELAEWESPLRRPPENVKPALITGTNEIFAHTYM